MSFSDLLKERLLKQYTRELFKMLPLDLHDSLKKVLCMRFDQEPPYEQIIDGLEKCFKRAVISCEPQCPPSGGSSPIGLSDRNRVSNMQQEMHSYVFEWNRSLGSKFRNALLQESVDFERAIEVKLSHGHVSNNSIGSADLSAVVNASSHEESKVNEH